MLISGIQCGGAFCVLLSGFILSPKALAITALYLVLSCIMASVIVGLFYVKEKVLGHGVKFKY